MQTPWSPELGGTAPSSLHTVGGCETSCNHTTCREGPRTGVGEGIGTSVGGGSSAGPTDDSVGVGAAA
jgi:hypothetical protein